MKKLIILVSAVGLSACSSGGGHSGGASSVYVPPRAAVTAAVATSNAEITNMKSEIVVKNGSTPEIVGATSDANGTYTSYRLDDVKLFIAENFDTPRAYVNLELNEESGEIDAIKMVVGGEESGRIARNTEDTSIFAGPIFEYVPDGDDSAVFRVVDTGQTMAALETLATEKELSGGHWNRINERMLFTTFGKDLGLQYADFGHFNPIYTAKNKNLTTQEQLDAARAGTLNRDASSDQYVTEADVDALLLTDKDYQLFAGGYAIDGTGQVDTLTPQNGTSYAGTAVGRIYVSIQSDGTDRTAALTAWNVPFDKDSDDDGTMDSYTDAAGHDMAQDYITTAATMTIHENGTQELSMPFNAQGFYNVTVTKPTDAEATFDFDHGTLDLSTSQYRMNTSPETTESNFAPGYYGVGTPVEAAGTARYATEKDLGSEISREWEFQAAYGMKKQ